MSASHARDTGDTRRERSPAHPDEGGGIGFDRQQAGHEFIARLLTCTTEGVLREPEERMEPESCDEKRFEDAAQIVGTQDVRRFVREKRGKLVIIELIAATSRENDRGVEDA